MLELALVSIALLALEYSDVLIPDSVATYFDKWL